MDTFQIKRRNFALIFLYISLFILGIKTLFHGFPDIERFFAEWMDERLMLTYIIKFGTLNFAPTLVTHPPLYHYLTFIPIAGFFVIGKSIGFFSDKVDFVRFYFNNTHYFFLIGRAMSYIFYWLSAIMVFKIARLFYTKVTSHITAISFLLVPRFIFDFSITRPETLLFLNTSIFFYFFLKFYLNNQKKKYLFLAAFFLGVSIATKYNALYLGSIFIPLLFSQFKSIVGGPAKDYREFLAQWLKAGIFIFLGFFICNPFFIIQFNKYFHNLMIFGVEMRYYWKADFGSSHLGQLMSFMYLNIFGFLILLFGAWSLFKEHKRLFFLAGLVILLYEAYFGIVFKNYSPLRYLNPLFPVAILIFAAGVDFIIRHRKRLVLILIMFVIILFYNYMDIWQALSFGKTHIQDSRAFIEKNIPEFATICISSDNFLPQLNMTRSSYHHLIESAPAWSIIRDRQGRELISKDIDNEENYDNIFRELRIESLMKKPQYNLLRWDADIRTEEDVINFLKENNIEYIISKDRLEIDNKKLEDIKIVSLMREFRPRNKRIYRIVIPTDVSVFLYKVNGRKISDHSS